MRWVPKIKLRQITAQVNSPNLLAKNDRDWVERLHLQKRVYISQRISIRHAPKTVGREIGLMVWIRIDRGSDRDGRNEAASRPGQGNEMIE